MPPKSSAKSGGSSKLTSKEKQTELPINTETLCDDEWKCEVIFLYEGDKVGFNFINLLQLIPTKQTTENFRIVSKSDVMKDVKKVGSKSAKTRGKEQVELTDEQVIMKCVKDNTAIPGSSLAKVLKKRLINIKVEDIKNRRKELAAFQDARKKPKKPQSEATKKGKKPIEPPSENQSEELKFVERLPLFVILIGFNEHDLPLELVKLDLPLRAVVNLIKQPIDETTNELVTSDIEKNNESILHLQSEKFNMSWLIFWRNFELLMFRPENANLSHDLAVVKFMLQEELEPDANIKNKKTIIMNTLNAITNHVRNLLDMHKTYIDNLSIIDVNQEYLNQESPDLYNTLVEMVPLESISIPVILFALIEQVSYWNRDEVEIDQNIDEESTSSRSNTHSHFSPKCYPALIRYNDEHSLKTFHLETPEIDFDYIVKRFLTKLPFFIPWLSPHKNDEMQKYYFEFHLQRLWKFTYRKIHINLFYIYLHWYILCKMKTYCSMEKQYDSNKYMYPPIDILDDWIKLSGIDDDTELLDFNDKNSDINCKSSINNSELIEESQSSSTFKSNYVQDDVTFNNKYRTSDTIRKNRHKNLITLKKFLYCPEIYCLCENEEMSNVSSNLKDFFSYTYIEEMPANSLLQAIQDSIFNYSQIEHIHYYPSNKLLLWFHNNKEIIFENYKTGKLDTCLGFRDYYIHKLAPIEEYLQNNTTNNTTQQNLDNIQSVYNIGKKMVQFEEHTKRFFSDDGTSVTVKIDSSYRSYELVNICINKIDTEMNISLDKLDLSDYDDNESQLEIDKLKEYIKVFVKFPNDIILNVKVNEFTTLGNSTSYFAYRDLILTLPTGLVIETVRDNNDIYIRQKYTSKGPNCSKIWDEECRCFTKSGNVIIFKSDETIDVLYSNTVVTKVCTIVDELVEDEIVPEIVKEVIATKKEKKKGKSGKSEKSEKIIKDVQENIQEKVKKLQCKVKNYVVKSWSGISYAFKDEKFDECADNVNLRTIFDPFKRLYMDRNDGTKCLFTDDSCLVSTFSDGTLLTTYTYEEPNSVELEDDEPRQSIGSYNEIPSGTMEDDKTKSDESYVSYKMGYIAEHPNYATVEFSPFDDAIKLELPGNLTIVISNLESDGTYYLEIDVNKKTNIEFNKDAINFYSYILKKSKLFNVTTISPLLVVDRTLEDAMYFCKTTDSFKSTFLVSKYGEVKLSPLSENNSDIQNSSSVSEKDDYYYETHIPLKLCERYFVVNKNYTGYEIISEKDVNLLEKDMEERIKNKQVAKTQTNNVLKSKCYQYLVFKTCSDEYILPLKLPFIDILPKIFQRADLSPPWRQNESPWFFIRTGRKPTFRQFSFTNIPKHYDRRLLAVITKTIQKVCDSCDFNGLGIVVNCLKKYKIENDKLCKKYKQQGFTDLDIDLRMKENNELISSVKKFPLWNYLRKECNLCKQTFGCPKKPSDLFSRTDKTVITPRTKKTVITPRTNKTVITPRTNKVNI